MELEHVNTPTGSIPVKYPTTLIIGPSGTGKSYSLRDLCPETTAIVECEIKDLPFSRAIKAKFKHFAATTDFGSTIEAMGRFAMHPEVTTIVVDSLSALLEYQEASSLAKSPGDGRQGWEFFRKDLAKLFKNIKLCPKLMIFTGHDEWLQQVNEQGAQTQLLRRRFKIRGKAWEGMVETQFTIVMFTNIVMKNGQPEYGFMTQNDTITSVKVPPDLGLPAPVMPNSLGTLVAAIGKDCGVDFTKPFSKPSKA